MYWLDPTVRMTVYPYPVMREWRESWGGGHLKWARTDSLNKNWENCGLGQIPKEPPPQMVIFPYFSHEGRK